MKKWIVKNNHNLSHNHNLNNLLNHNRNHKIILREGKRNVSVR